MTLNLIETPKTSKYSPKHTKNIKMHDHFFKMFKKNEINIFKKNNK